MTWLDPRIADHGKRIARRAAIRIVIDYDIRDRAHAALPRAEVDPSACPISRSFEPSAMVSRLLIGSTATQT
jgi:hypothetical protein